MHSRAAENRSRLVSLDSRSRVKSKDIMSKAVNAISLPNFFTERKRKMQEMRKRKYERNLHANTFPPSIEKVSIAKGA